MQEVLQKQKEEEERLQQEQEEAESWFTKLNPYILLKLVAGRGGGLMLSFVDFNEVLQDKSWIVVSLLCGVVWDWLRTKFFYDFFRLFVCW